VAIEDELARLYNKNECVQLMQEQMARRKATTKRTEVMQQEIEQEQAKFKFKL
jgi:hypothetical protein